MAYSRRYTIACGSVGMLIAALVTLTLRPVFIAISVRNDIAKIRKGHFNEQQLRQWAARHHGDVIFYQGRYNGRVCLTNRLLHALHLAPLTIFDAEVEVADNRPVQSILSISDAQYLPPAASGAGTMVVIEYEPSRYSEPFDDLLVREVPKGKLRFRHYSVTPQSSPPAIARAFKINVWCLARVGGCSPSQQAPDIWALPSTPPVKWAGHEGPSADRSR